MQQRKADYNNDKLGELVKNTLTRTLPSKAGFPPNPTHATHATNARKYVTNAMNAKEYAATAKTQL